MSFLRFLSTLPLLLIAAPLAASPPPTAAPAQSSSASSLSPLNSAPSLPPQAVDVAGRRLSQAPTDGEEPTEPEAVDSELDAAEETTDAAVDLRVQPRVGAGYSTDGGGYPSLGSFEAFAPIWQSVGESLGFMEGRLVLNSDDTTAGGALLGYRGYSPSVDRIRGGYLGFDLRGTPSSTFYQLSSGYESLGRDWDFRLNGYLPIGDRDRTTSDVTRDVGLQTSTRFEGNLLLLETERQRQRLVQRESALGGLDAEAGTRLARWATGDLKGFGGLYLQSAPDLGSYIGWRLRLAADVTPNFSAGLTFQGDGLFGNRVVLGVGATFPGVRPTGAIPEADQVRARLGEPTTRLPEIAVQFTSESTLSVEDDSQPLQNPREQQNYRFQHVSLGQTGGDGTFENPFGTVQEALNATVGDGNDVVYVDRTTDELIPAFTIPDQVQVLSQGPRQQLAGLPFSGFAITPTRLPFSNRVNYTTGIVVELPGSGDGNFPLIDGVTLGNGTVLAGFQLVDVEGDAIVGANVRDVELRNNTITNPGQRGIFLNNVGGSAILFDNAISGARGIGPDSGQGILIRNTTALNALEATIAGFQVDRNRVGIELISLGSLNPRELPNQIVSLGPSNPANTSIGLSPGTTMTNSVSNNRNEGIRITSANLGGQEVTVRGATISDNDADGMLVTGGVAGGFLTSFQEVRVRDSVLSGNRGAGMRIEGNERSTQELNIDSNQITDNDGTGIISVANDSALQEFVAKTDLESLGIGTNVISGNDGGGLSFTTANSETLLLEIAQNQFANNGAGFDMRVSDVGTARTCFIARFNEGQPRIQLNNPVGTRFQVGNLANLSANNDNAAVTLNPAPASFTNIDRQVCL